MNLFLIRLKKTHNTSRTYQVILPILSLKVKVQLQVLMLEWSVKYFTKEILLPYLQSSQISQKTKKHLTHQ
jgi:hypothetical protein